ncbi:MAG: ThiF family adenylyltransferase, partial [Deltaproteobacteria bacterium]|nr:ThiF family adenylyltransferase [Deltaproteobacteria bacterium]
VLGCGGIGGTVAHALARTGVGRMVLADPDHFELANFNRQAGAQVSTIGQPKAQALAQQLRDINPDLELAVHEAAVGADNIASLLAGVDLVVDAVDFFCVDARLDIYRYCRRERIPVIMSAPLGMSCTVSLFTPDSMSFERYYDIRPGMDQVDQLVAFLVGLAPRMSHRGYMDMQHTNIAAQYGPSLGAAVMLGAGMLAVETLRILLGRPGLEPAPYYLQFDAYRRRLYRGKLRFGNRGPLQRLKRSVARRTLMKKVQGLDV